MATKSLFAKAEAALRAHALSKPEATEHFPWGERAIKVKGKVFLFMYGDATKPSLSTKLPDSHGVALMLPFAQPTGYGLGKAGWVTAVFERGGAPPIDMLQDWIDESYVAVAPAKLAAVTTPPAPRSPAKRPAKAARRPARAPAPKTPRRPAKPAAPARTSARRARGAAR